MFEQALKKAIPSQLSNFSDVVQSGPPCAIEIVLPQVVAIILAVVLVVYLWQIQEKFDLKREKKQFVNERSTHV